MKKLKYVLGILIALSFMACGEGTDSISKKMLKQPPTKRVLTTITLDQLKPE